MATQRCERCVYTATGDTCVSCEQLAVSQARQATRNQTSGNEIFGVLVSVEDLLFGDAFQFVATIEDDGVLIATEHDYHGDYSTELGDPDERNERAWAAIDLALGFDARKSAVDSGFSGGFLPFPDGSNVSYVMLPHELTLLVRRALVKAREACGD